MIIRGKVHLKIRSRQRNREVGLMKERLDKEVQVITGVNKIRGEVISVEKRKEREMIQDLKGREEIEMID